MKLDLSTPESVIAAMYGAISFGPGAHPDYDSFRLLFHNQARISPPIEDTGGVVASMSVDDFIDSFHSILQREKLLEIGATEFEVANKVDVFKRVAQVFSSYHFVLCHSKEPLARGTNAMQLIFDDNRWWILSLTWDRASGGEDMKYQSSRFP